MEPRSTPADFSDVLAGGTGERIVTALTFAPPEALAALSHTVGAGHALADAALALEVDVAFVPSWAPWAPAAVRLLLESDIAPAWVVRGPLWPALEQTRVEVGLRMTARDPEALVPALDAQVERSRSGVLAGMRLGARVIVAAEDLAGTSGLLVAPDFALAEVVPRLETVVSAAVDGGLAAILHSDGDIRVLLRALARAGFSAVHAGGGLERDGFERQFWAARRVGLAVLGGIATADLATPTRAVFAGTSASVLARGGGLIIADDGGIHTPGQMAVLGTAFSAARCGVGD